MNQNKSIIDIKNEICIDKAEDAKECIEKLIERLKERKFFPNAQTLAKDVLILMGDILRNIGELQVLENVKYIVGKEQG